MRILINLHNRLVFLSIVIFLAILNNACDSSDGDAFGAGDNTSGSGSGRGGSMARFTVIGDYMYALAGSELQIIDISIPATPTPFSRLRVGWDVETLFAMGDSLFMGSQSGMYIYDVADPVYPNFVSKLVHARSCDPVVVQGDYAYVTLRGGSVCEGFQNQLDIIDVTDYLRPVTVKSYPMQAPKGLGVDGDKLFVCDGIAGLKVFDNSNPLSLRLLESEKDVNCFDVIPNKGVLIVSDEFGLLQYDYSQAALNMLSEILIVGESS